MKMNKTKANQYLLYGINNSLEILKSKKIKISSIYLLKDGIAIKDKYIKKNINDYRSKILILNKNDFNKKYLKFRSQGIVINFEFSIIDYLPQFKNKNTCLLLPEGIEDPQNLGQIIRTSECAGINGILLTEHRSVGITNSVLQVSQGSFINMPIYKIGNINQTLEMLKNEGFWIVGIENSIDASEWHEINLCGKIVLIFGSEGKGIRKNTLKRCDFLATIPMHGITNSLNISATVSAILFERNRQLTVK